MKHPIAILLFLSVSVRAAPFQPPNWNVTALSKPPVSIDVQEGKVEGLQKGMRVTVTPQVTDPGKADKVEATKPAPSEKKSTETEE